MIRALFLSVFLSLCIGFAQVPAYYSGIDFTKEGDELKAELASLITSTHTPITYSQCWDVLKTSDLDPDNSANVLLVYGYQDDSNPVTDRTRDKNANGGSPGEWNREHVYPKSLGTPDLGSSGPGSDAHNLRACDVQQNGNRNNRKFTDGSGNPGTVGDHWYPGDEWKGDCARIIMYMYVRYNSRCLPSNAVNGTANAMDPNMVDLLLDWNAEDPVSTHEQNRNNGIYAGQNNRNPFIDNPSIANKIWGGTPAEDPWGGLSTGVEKITNVLVYPQPSLDQSIYISSSQLSSLDEIRILSLNGQLLQEIHFGSLNSNELRLEELPQGNLILQLQFEQQIIHKRILIQ
jgi:endonuclease I